MLILLLQAALFQSYLDRATDQLKFQRTPVEEVRVNYGSARYLAWVGTCFRGLGCSPRVYVAQDVNRLATPLVIEYLAYHEACHLSLYHHLWPRTRDGHLDVDTCMIGALGRQRYDRLSLDYWGFIPYLRKKRILEMGPGSFR